jgi:cytoskeletal protein CcmA (bactofilin family)
MQTSTAELNFPADRLNAINSLVCAGATFKGTFESESQDAALRVDGRLQGGAKLATGGIVHITAEGSVVDGDIEADVVIIEGEVQGNVRARKHLEITTGAVLRGSASYCGELHIHRNARLHATLQWEGAAEIKAESLQLAQEAPASNVLNIAQFAPELNLPAATDSQQVATDPLQARAA